MRKFAILLLLVAAVPASGRAAVTVPMPNACNDRNALQNIAIDARLIAIQFYYQGIVQNLSDKSLRTCYEAHVLADESFTIINRTRALVEGGCLTIDAAARTAMQGVCP